MTYQVGRGRALTQEEYRRHAALCLELANETTEERDKSALIDMAQAWMRLAEQAEKNSALDIVYETPRKKPQSDK
jgi:hypothetical protein